MLAAFLNGFFLCLGLIIPLGMQNIFIFNQGATQKHFFNALPSVLTAFICDAVLISAAVLGVSLIVLEMPWLRTGIYIVGILFLSYMGVMLLRSHAKVSADYQPLGAKMQIVFALSVSILNPHALLDTIAVIGPTSLQFFGAEKWMFLFACILVSFWWFFGMAFAGHCLKKLDQGMALIGWVNRLSAVIMWGTAVYLAHHLYGLLHSS